MKDILIAGVLILFASCSKNKSDSTQMQYSFDNIISYNDTLFIKSEFSDCGEWGGHKELIKVYHSEKDIKLTYIQYEINCESKDQTGSIIQNEKLKKNISLSRFQKQALMDYINNSMLSKFLNKVISNSGNYFTVENNKGDIKIIFGGNNPIFLKNYNILMTKLEFPKVIINDY